MFYLLVVYDLLEKIFKKNTTMRNKEPYKRYIFVVQITM